MFDEGYAAHFIGHAAQVPCPAGPALFHCLIHDGQTFGPGQSRPLPIKAGVQTNPIANPVCQ
jgi:hypothetical protein